MSLIGSSEGMGRDCREDAECRALQDEGVRSTDWESQDFHIVNKTRTNPSNAFHFSGF